MIEAIDSFFKTTKNRILSINSNRKVIGVMTALDWPPQTVQMESFYLLTLAETPVRKEAWSPSNPIMTFTLQWVWMIAGTDLQPGLKGRNRGDRYRTAFAMKDELRKALYPQFCEKKYITTDSNGTVSFNSFDPPDYIRWTPPEFRDRSDRDSGLIYGLCALTLTAVTSEIST